MYISVALMIYIYCCQLIARTFLHLFSKGKEKGRQQRVRWLDGIVDMK